MSIQLTSSAFTAGGKIPRAHGCEGGDTSPALAWDGVPPGAQSLALTVTDPDAPDPAAPKTVWAHWVVYNLPPDLRALPQGGALPAGAQVGKNDWGAPAYRGPCPPIGRHRYFFRVYALDRMLELKTPTRLELEAALRGHVLAQGELMGTYQKGD
jgi:Raf kinase inhibitor-like YbhB/YbcL family protein